MNDPLRNLPDEQPRTTSPTARNVESVEEAADDDFSEALALVGRVNERVRKSTETLTPPVGQRVA